MKTIVKELVLLDVKDVEEALSAELDRKVSISEVDCTLEYYHDIDDGYPTGMLLAFEVDDEEYEAGDLFGCSDDDAITWKGKRLSINEDYLPVNEIFNFDTSVFKSFEIEYCSDD